MRHMEDPKFEGAKVYSAFVSTSNESLEELEKAPKFSISSAIALAENGVILADGVGLPKEAEDVLCNVINEYYEKFWVKCPSWRLQLYYEQKPGCQPCRSGTI